MEPCNDCCTGIGAMLPSRLEGARIDSTSRSMERSDLLSRSGLSLGSAVCCGEDATKCEWRTEGHIKSLKQVCETRPSTILS